MNITSPERISAETICLSLVASIVHQCAAASLEMSITQLQTSTLYATDYGDFQKIISATEACKIALAALRELPAFPD